MSTANHLWPDVSAGFLLAGLAALFLHDNAAGWLRGRPDAAPKVPAGS